MTAEEYYSKVSTFDDDCIELLASQIPKNINPTGKVYQRRLRDIYENINQTKRTH